MKWISVNMALGFEREGWQVFRYWQAAACRAAGKVFPDVMLSRCGEAHLELSSLSAQHASAPLTPGLSKLYCNTCLFLCVFFWDVCYVQMCCKSHAGNSYILWVFCRDVVGNYRWLKWVESSEFKSMLSKNEMWQAWVSCSLLCGKVLFKSHAIALNILRFFFFFSLKGLILTC